MNVLVTCGDEKSILHPLLEEWRELAAIDIHGKHHLTNDPELADLILFTDRCTLEDPYQMHLRMHPYWRKYSHKILNYDESDGPLIPLPGLMVSCPKPRFDSRLYRASPYYRTVQKIEAPMEREPDLLFSFVGIGSHPCRDEIFQLRHPRAIIEDSGINFFPDKPDEEYKRRLKQQSSRYLELVGRSKFVLCPRGVGTSSFRMYEVMAAGRVPVVISDEWVPSQGPDWSCCILRYSESEIEQLPQLLEAKEADYELLAANAYETYHTWFAPNVIFHTMVEECAGLLETRPYKWSRRFPARLFVRLFRRWIRLKLAAIRAKS